MIKKTAPVSGKRCLSDAETPESGTTSSITQNSRKTKGDFYGTIKREKKGN